MRGNQCCLICRVLLSDQNIQYDVAEEVIEVLADEGVIQDLGVLASKNLLDRIYVILLVSRAKVHSRLDLRVLVVDFGLSGSIIVDLGGSTFGSRLRAHQAKDSPFSLYYYYI